ncbi:MAG: glycosyltransferase [Clostridiales Family XIII bacterium]|nr:glycosyltransferase [Clostridiales Family XIII bacterium]
MPKVSIIIPCLNSVKYIRETMESVVNQTLKEIEIIVVDAGSTDGTLDILNEYARADSRVRLLHSEKKSMGYQYNIGMDAALGEYIGFVETDDYTELVMYEYLYEAITESNVDYAKARFNMFVDLPDERLVVSYSPLPRNKAHMRNRVMAGCELEELSACDVNIWNGIYGKKFIQKNNIRFSETAGAAFQDTGFVVQTMMLAEKALYIDRPSYRYRRDNSASSIYDGKAYKFMMDEFMYAYPIIQAKKREASLIGQRTLDRHFGLFGYFLGRSLLRGKSEDGLFEEVRPFREFILDAYRTLDEAEKAWTDLRNSLFWSLFVNDFDLYCALTGESAEQRLKTCLEFIGMCERQDKIVIFGCGDAGSGAYCYSRRGGLKNIVGFCDNDDKQWGKIHMGQTVFSPKEAMEKYKDALYAIAITDLSHAESIRKQLIGAGIRPERIYRSPVIYPHESFEIPTVSGGISL